MKDKERLLIEAISLLNTLKEDAEMALDGRWDRNNHGFEAQLDLINGFLNSINDK